MFYIFGFYKFKKLNNLRKLKKIFQAKLVENAVPFKRKTYQTILDEFSSIFNH